MIKYIAVEKDTPNIPRAWGEGETDLIARYQCEIALREKLLGKIKRGCQEGFAQTHLYIIKPEPNIQPKPKQLSFDFNQEEPLLVELK